MNKKLADLLKSKVLIFGIYGVSAAAPIGEVSLTVLLYFGVKKAKQGGN